jgi:hypothetical protein
MRSHSKLKSLVALTLGLLALVLAPRAEAQTTPTVAQVPANAPPAIPAGMKVACMQGPNVLTAATNCPVLKWHGYTYWAFSYGDNRVAMGIVAYDPAGKVAAQWERPGARYVYAITVDSTGKSVTFAGQSDAKITMTWDALFPPPVIDTVAVNTPPAVPAGMKVTCTQGPGTGASATTCPVIRWGGYTYWAFSYIDNRVAMGIVAYDAAGKVVAQWEKTGARYVYAITSDAVGRTVTFAGQSDAKITMRWSELFPPVAPLPTPRWEMMAGPVGATLKQVSVANANSIWGLDTAGYLWKWNGTAWVKLKGTVTTIAAAADGTVWATNPPDSLRVLKWDPVQSTWTWNIPTGMKQVTAVSATKAWGLDNGGALFEWTGSAWAKKGCCVSQISVGADGELWATNPPDSLRVLRWNGIQWTWAIPTGMTYVSVGNAQNIWALDGSDQIFKWNGTAWQKMPGLLRNISAAGDGTVWGINAQGSVYKWVP